MVKERPRPRWAEKPMETLNVLVIIQFYMSVHLIIYTMLNLLFITFLFHAHHVFLFPLFAVRIVGGGATQNADLWTQV